MKNNILIILSVFLLTPVHGQSQWLVAEGDGGKLSIQIFDEDFALEGKLIYNTSCTSCHGTPEQGNYTMMSPPPGDISEDRFRVQKDGELLYKIQKGRGSMPAFENSFSEREIWSLVAYMRSFHSGYEQQFPDLEGIEIPQLELSLGYDENVDKLVVRVSDEKTDQAEGVSVRAYVKGMFGNHFLGKALTNEYGIAYIPIDVKLPGDREGYLSVLLKADKGYGNAKLEERIQAASPTQVSSAIEGRHLWSRARKAPIWMIVFFNLIGVGIWSVILFIIVSLRRIRKLQ